MAASFWPAPTTMYSGTLAASRVLLVVAVGDAPNATWQLVVATTRIVLTPVWKAVDVAVEVEVKETTWLLPHL
jgi:hypothetical protein